MKDKSTREKILEAGLEEFAKYGYFGATMERIAKKVGVTKAMIFYYFKNKKNFYLKLLEQIFSELKEKLETPLKRAQTPKELVTAIVDAYFEVFGKNKNYIKIFSNIHGIGEKVFKEQPQFFIDYKNCLFSNFKRVFSLEEEELFNLLINLMGMIFFTFLGEPIYSQAFPQLLKKNDRREFLEKRKKEIIKLVLSSKNLIK